MSLWYTEYNRLSRRIDFNTKSNNKNTTNNYCIKAHILHLISVNLIVATVNQYCQ